MTVPSSSAAPNRRRTAGVGVSGSGRSSTVLSAAAAAAVAATCVVGATSAAASSSSSSTRPTVTSAGPFGVRPSLNTPFQLHGAIDSFRGGSAASPGDETGGSSKTTQDVHVDGSSVRGGAVEAEATTTTKKKKKRSKSKKKRKEGASASASADAAAKETPEADAAADDFSSSTKEESSDQAKSAPSASSPTDEKQPKAHHSTHKHHHKSHSHLHKHKSSKTSTHQQDAIIRNILSASDHYEVLDIAKTATENEIRKAYRRRAVRTHPDKVPNGDRTAFGKVAKAYEILSDETKRNLYDRFGDEGVEAGGNPNGGFGGFGGAGGGMFGSAAGSAEDVFRTFFGAARPGAGRGGPNNPFQPRNRNARYQMEVSLEDLYNGLTRTVTIAQPTTSAGKRRKTVEVTVPRGMAEGQTVVLPGEIDHVPGSAPADVVFVLAQRRHPVFSRRGHDLAIEVTITLREALCGFRRSFVHLDGRTVVIGPPRAGTRSGRRRTSRSEDASTDEMEEQPREAPVLIRTGDVHVLRGEGMPKPSGSGSKGGFGDLYVQYKVEMPSANSAAGGMLTVEERDELDRLLRKLEGSADNASQVNSESDDLDDTDNVRFMEKASASDYGRASGIFKHHNHHGEEHLHHDEDEQQQHSSFFNAFGAGGPTSGFHYYSSSRGSGSDDPNVQCQQM